MKPTSSQLKLTTLAFAMTLLVSGLTSGGAFASEGQHGHGLHHDSAFTTILGHYEEIRQMLLADRSAGLAEHANAIQDSVLALQKDFSSEKAGVRPGEGDKAKELLPALSKAAVELAEAPDIEVARQALYPLSKALVRYRKLATGELPVVAYCSMSKKSWLQPSGDIGNPYFGQAMPTCGEIVDG
jgi:hypothetical protein